MHPVTGKSSWLEIALIGGIIALSLATAAIVAPAAARWLALALAGLGTGQLVLVGTRWREATYSAVPSEDDKRSVDELDELRKITAAATSAQALNDAKVAALSHQLRSSLNGVVGLADALLHSDLNPHQRRSVTILQQAGEDMAQVIDGLRSDASTLPARPGRRDPLISTLERQTHASFEPPHQPVEPRVLLVDDIAVNRLICRTFLQKLGLTVDEAVNGQEAVHMANKTDYSVILMDVQMPVMDGYEATRQIRKQLGNRAPPILAVTANVLPEDKEMCEQCGMVAHLGKPIHLASLERLLARWIPLPTH